MGVMVLPERRAKRDDSSSMLASVPGNLVEELMMYRRRSERLGRIHELHRQLSQKLDITSMVEAVSVWLSNYCDHELVGYAHRPRQRFHISCSRHGPDRRKLQESANKLLTLVVAEETFGVLDDHLAYRIFPLNGGDDQIVVIYQCTQCSANALSWQLHEALEELRGPFDRAMAYEELYDQARRDALTGLCNRRVFEETALREITHASRYQLPLSLAALDLDFFKTINDTLGHAVGDSVLRRVAGAMQETIRDSDHLSRLGGDEFLLLMPKTTAKDALLLSQRLCLLVTSLDIHAPDAPALGVSIGVAQWQPGEVLATWMERADAALYRAKSLGRCQAAF